MKTIMKFPRLAIISGSRAGTFIEIDVQPVTFGRKPDRTVVFSADDVVVSADHAELRNEAGQFVIYDEGSRNGTFVNGEQVFRRVLVHGDMVQFGLGGPSARFSERLDTIDSAAVTRQTQPSIPLPLPWKRIRGPRQRLAVTLRQLNRRTRRAIVAIAVAGALVIGGVAIWQQRSRARLERALITLSRDLVAERTSRAKVETDLSAVQSRYDSLRALVVRTSEGGGVPGSRKARAPENYTAGVALIVFSYGFADPQGNELLRYVVDGRGQPLMVPGPGREMVPAIRFGGDGPPVVHDGTATGFLVDSAGLLLTNRHVVEPWAYDNELETMRGNGIQAVGRLLSVKAYFPPGDQSFKLEVVVRSDRADVALMRIVDGRVHAPVMLLASPRQAVRPGDQLRLIGYPTGVYNLLFRVGDSARHEIIDRVGQDSYKLLDELADRKLIQPLVTTGTVSDTTGIEVIHTAATTVGGSGGPLFDENQLVVAIQHASVGPPTRGDPFRTQRAVPIRFAWEILPRKTAVR